MKQALLAAVRRKRPLSVARRKQGVEVGATVTQIGLHTGEMPPSCVQNAQAMLPDAAGARQAAFHQSAMGVGLVQGYHEPNRGRVQG